MTDHRVRLTDHELDLIVGALRARAAGCSPKTGVQLLMLAGRLADCRPGNPALQIHGGGIIRAAIAATAPQDT